MKTIKLLFAAFIVLAMIISCGPGQKAVSRAADATAVACVYTSKLPVPVAVAGILEVRYPNTTFYNITDFDSADVDALIAAIDTDSYHKIYLALDTATAAATYYVQGYLYDSLVAKLYGDTTNGIAPDADLQYLASTATHTKAEVLWDALYPGITEPLIIQYLGFAEFSEYRSRAEYASTDSTLVDTLSVTADAYIGDNIYITLGTGIGQVREIYDNTTTIFYVTPDWTTNPTHDTYFVVKKAAEDDENFYDMYSALYVCTYLGELSSGATATAWHKLMDKEYNINDGNVYKTPYQDLTYLNGTVLAGGKHIYDYLVAVAQ